MRRKQVRVDVTTKLCTQEMYRDSEDFKILTREAWHKRSQTFTRLVRFHPRGRLMKKDFHTWEKTQSKMCSLKSTRIEHSLNSCILFAWKSLLELIGQLALAVVVSAKVMRGALEGFLDRTGASLPKSEVQQQECFSQSWLSWHSLLRLIWGDEEWLNNCKTGAVLVPPSILCCKCHDLPMKWYFYDLNSHRRSFLHQFVQAEDYGLVLLGWIRGGIWTRHLQRTSWKICSFIYLRTMELAKHYLDVPGQSPKLGQNHTDSRRPPTVKLMHFQAFGKSVLIMDQFDCLDVQSF